MTDSPDPVTVGANLTYVLTLTNTGPSAAMAVTITNILASGVSFVSATGSQGSVTQPVNQTVKSGANVIFTVYARGSLPLSYQWRKDGTNFFNGGRIAGATTAN